MIVPQGEINLVNRGARTQMWIPVEHGELGERLPCRFERAELLRLQPRQFVKGTQTTVTNVEWGRLGAMTDTHARQQGFYGGVQSALETWTREHGDARPEREVWIVRFVLGDHTAFFDLHTERFLSRKGARLTTDPEKAAKGEGSVPHVDEMKLAAAARVKREAEQELECRRARKEMLSAIERLRGLDRTMEIATDLGFMERRLAKINRLLGLAA